MYALDLLKKMLSIYSPSGRETQLASFLESEMRHLGLRDVHIDSVGNVSGEVGTGHPVTVLCGHMDTVPGFIEVKEDGKILYGRGAVDAKSSLSAMIMAASQLREKNVGRTVVIGVIDEEGDGKGIEYVSREKFEADCFIFGEPSGVDKITIGYKGRVQFTLNLRAMGGHASAPWAAENAVERAFDLLKDIKDNLFPDSLEEKDRFHTVSICPTLIRGGEFPNNIPENCQLTLDIRVPPQIKCDDINAKLNNIVEGFGGKNPKLTVQGKVDSFLDAYEADQNSLLVTALKKSILHILRKESRLIRKTGTGDMNVIGLGQGIPVVTYGPGDSRLDHTANEHINIDEYLKTIEIYQKAVEYIAEDH